MVVGEPSIHNIMGGMESTGGVRLHNHKRKLKQRFDIIKKLGQGTYGKVQLGINKETGQEVAIKTIKKCKIETEADLIRIRREIQIMSSVQHPNIIHIYEVFENKEKMVLVMEYAAGGELYDYLSERKVLSEEEARRIFRQISIAVYYCHKHKICHRDLKLENILLDQIGNAKIADFGLSNVFDEQRLLNTFCGSPLYASPEIVKGTPYHGPEVDCWSLGVLLYTLVYGAMPFDGSNFKRLTRQISQSDYFEPKNPSPASPLIKDMLTKCPSRRSDIEKICSHWWVNEGYEQNCLDIAEDLAAQTPVRLDLLLSLVPQSASADKLVVGDERQTGEIANEAPAESVGPTRCHSVGSLMDLDCNNSDRRVQEMVDQEPRISSTVDSKRKLENTPSMEETADLEAGVKRKERLRKKDKNDETRPHRFTSNRHHSAPISHSITEEAMEIDPSGESGSTKPLLDLRNDETASACLELIKESLSKSPSKERSKTPIKTTEQAATIASEVKNDVNENVKDVKPIMNKMAGVKDASPEPIGREIIVETGTKRIIEDIDDSSKKDIETSNNTPNVTSMMKNDDESRESTKTDDKKVPMKKDNDTTTEMTSLKEAKKLKQKAASLDSEVPNEAGVSPGKTTERRRSKIFETAEKFNQLAAGVESDKPKKIFIPGVNVGGAKRAFERKASLTSVVTPQPVKQSSSKVLIDVPNERKNDKTDDKLSGATRGSREIDDDAVKREAEKKQRAVDIITGAIGKPPVQRKVNGSPPATPQTPESKKLGLKIQVGPNDVRSATVSVSTPIETKFPFETKPASRETSMENSPERRSVEGSYGDEPTVSSKMEITLKSATLPRQRKTSKAEITLSGTKSSDGIGAAFKSEVEAKIDAFHPQKLRTQRSEVAFPVAAVAPQNNRSSSLEPESAAKIPPKERIIPIQVESDDREQRKTSTPPPKPPMPQRSTSQRSGSLSRQSTADSDTDSALGSTLGPEPIRKSPREYIIPIAVEGGGYVTPRSGSVEPESKTGTPTSANPPRSRFGRPRRMSSLLSDASEDESPFSTLHRDSDDLLQRHMHRLRSSRPTRQPPEHADSLSSGEDDDDDGFELLTAENLFSTLLSRVRSLTQRLNVDDNRSSGFPSSRLLGRLGSNASQGFWGLHEPLSRRLSESQFRRSMSRDPERFGKRDSAVPSNSGTPSSPGARSTPSRESIFEMGSSNTLPRDRKGREETVTEDGDLLRRKSTRDTMDCNFTPSLARRLSRQFIEQTRQSLPRSPSIPREKLYVNASLDDKTSEMKNRQYASTIADRREYRSRSCDRGVRRVNSLLDSNERIDRIDPRSPRRSVSLFEDEDDDEDDDDDEETLSSSSLPRQVMTLGRKYREGGKSALANFNNYRNEKIQEEPHDESYNAQKHRFFDDRVTARNSRVNSATEGVTELTRKSRNEEMTTTDSSSRRNEDSSGDFASRLLAAENLIRESKARNFRAGSAYDRDSTASESSSAIDIAIDDSTKRRSCIPSLRLRSGSLTRESSIITERRRNAISSGKESSNEAPVTPERSLLDKLFRGGSSSAGVKSEQDARSSKVKGPRRISRFLRPDFFDTPREESRYVKEKEAQKAAENERRKSRFTKKKSGDVAVCRDDDDEMKMEPPVDEDKPEKELKNEANAMRRDKTEISSKDNKTETEDERTTSSDDRKIERQSSKGSFLQSLERKLEKFRSSDEGAKLTNGNCANGDDKERETRENSAPHVETTMDIPEVTKESANDSRSDETNAIASKSRVSTVLGLFKNDSGRMSINGQRSQSTILSKFKRNPYKGSRSDGVLSIDQQSPSTSSSKIPTKFAKIDVRSKKIPEMKKSPEKSLTEMKKSSSSKESSPTEKSGARRSTERQAGITKKTSPEKTIDGVKQDKPEKSTCGKEKSGENRAARSSTRKLSSEKIADNRQTEARSNDADDKRIVVRAKKSVKSLSGLVKNGSLGKVETRDKTTTDEIEKRIVSKAAKSRDNGDKDTADGTRKKKIVRIAKKMGKSSEVTDVKPDVKETVKKTLIKRITSGTKKDTSPDNATKRIKEKSPEIGLRKIEDENDESCAKIRDESPDETSGNEKIIDKEASSGAAKSNDRKSGVTECSGDTAKVATTAVSENPSASASTPRNDARIADAESKKIIPALGSSKSNRVNLKLDLTKIPQHAFKNGGSAKKDGAAESSNAKTIVGKIVVTRDTPRSTDADEKTLDDPTIVSREDKPADSRDAAIFQREITSPEIPKDAGNVCSSRKRETPTELDETNEDDGKSESRANLTTRPTSLSFDHKSVNPCRLTRAISNDPTDDMFSPLDDAESFDSWSICSADMNHHRHDFNSPTSPSSYSPVSRFDNSESIIDRIRRKSFYSRFNERKRKSSLNASSSLLSSGVSLPTSTTTLPRKFTFDRSRDRYDCKKPNIYSGTARRSLERSCSLYGDDDVAPANCALKSSVRERRSSDSIGNLPTLANDSRGSKELYGGLGACYDSPRRYRRVTSPESSSLQRNYRSIDYGLDNDAGAYKSPRSSSSFRNDSSLDRCASRNNTLPRKHGNSCPEVKTADYYEELLTPPRSDYSTLRKTPVANDYHSRNENGYHNDHCKVQRETINDGWNGHSDRIAGPDLTKDNDGRHDKQIWSNAERDNESQDPSILNTERDAEASKVE